MWGIQFQLKASRHARRGGGGRGGHPIRERDDGGDGGTGATVKGSANKSPCPYGPPGATAAPASVVGGPPRIKNALPPSPENREAAALPPPPPPFPPQNRRDGPRAPSPPFLLKAGRTWSRPATCRGQAPSRRFIRLNVGQSRASNNEGLRREQSHGHRINHQKALDGSS